MWLVRLCIFTCVNLCSYVMPVAGFARTEQPEGVEVIVSLGGWGASWAAYVSSVEEKGRAGGHD
jgi:hypothetical protein